jgi:hypothetical protein
MKSLKQLKGELKESEKELNEIGNIHCGYSDMEDCNDRYQDKLEEGWAKDEVRDRIKTLNTQIQNTLASTYIANAEHKHVLTDQEITNIKKYNNLNKPQR